MDIKEMTQALNRRHPFDPQANLALVRKALGHRSITSTSQYNRYERQPGGGSAAAGANGPVLLDLQGGNKIPVLLRFEFTGTRI